MAAEYYTHALWRVKDGKVDEFVAAWEDLGRVFTALSDPPASEGTLVQSVDDPLAFCSFGAWASLDAVARMREDPDAAAALGRVRDLCTEASPGAFRVVRRVPAPGRRVRAGS